MQLKELKQTKCPDCGERIVAITQESQHTNGHWFEKIRFKCHCEIEFVPNFMRSNIISSCTNTQVFKNQCKKRTTSRDRLLNYIRKMKIDKDIKKEWFDAVNNVYIKGVSFFPEAKFEHDENT